MSFVYDLPDGDMHHYDVRYDGNGFRILQTMLSQEKSMIDRGAIQAIGRRLVAVSA